ncbi:uncharacterized protein RJT21DRAFT_116317 [Scheffersomyces amazonensis]|uniref:uncharacterized protein n=1 Tax=Scheffersomyces amazonensis TaxID=1078765 RepID=UPI00315D1892
MACSVANIVFIFNETWIYRTATCVKSTLEPPNPATSLESLPDEILVQIIDHLNQFDVLDLCLTNSRFYSLCMSKLFKRAFITLSDPDVENLQDYAIFHRKLNTFTYTNSTVLSGKYNSVYISSPIYKFVKRFEIVEKEYRLFDEYYMTIDQFEKIAFSHELINRHSSIFSSKPLRIDLSYRLGTYIEFIRSNRNFMCSFKKVILSSKGLLGDLEGVTQLQGIFSEANSLCLYSFFFFVKKC